MYEPRTGSLRSKAIQLVVLRAASHVETDCQVQARYLRDPLEECSDPELWQRLHHGDGESSESDVSMTSTSQPHDPYAATVIEAIDRGAGTVRNLAICNWWLEPCTRLGDFEKLMTEARRYFTLMRCMP